MTRLTTIEQEQVYTWLTHGADGGPTEQENAMNWLTSIGSGAAQGAATGAVAGPWGALIGGIVGAGLGALQQATQQSAQPSPSPPPRSAPPAPPRPAPAPRPPSTSPPPRAAPAGGTAGTAAVQQIAQVLPQLLQLVQTIQPVLTSLQSLQSGPRPGEDVDSGESPETLAGDQLPDSAFGRESVTESARDEDHIEYAQPTEAEEPAPASGLPPSVSMPLTAPTPAWLLSGQSRSYDFTYPGEWSDEAESLALLPGQSSAFQWTLA